MIILDGSVDGLEWFEAKNWKSITFNYKDATSYRILNLILYVLGLLTGPLGMYGVLRGSLQHLGLLPEVEAMRLSLSGLVAVLHKGFNPISVTYRRAFFQNFMHWL